MSVCCVRSPIYNQISTRFDTNLQAEINDQFCIHFSVLDSRDGNFSAIREIDENIELIKLKVYSIC